jgi:hypothetical protein
MGKRIPAKNGGELEPLARGEHKGRAKGTPNKVTSLIKETAISACVKVGTPRRAYDEDGKFIGWMPTGEGGLEGYFMHVACINEGAMIGLLGKILPQQVNVKRDEVVRRVTRTAVEVREELIRRGVPQSMIPLPMPPGMRVIEGDLSLKQEDVTVEK